MKKVSELYLIKTINDMIINMIKYENLGILNYTR